MTKYPVRIVCLTEETTETLYLLGLVGCQAAAERLADRFAADLDRIRESASRFPRRLRVFFEEWDEPLISGIRWVEELVEIAGGAPIFPELAEARLARDRVVDPSEVARRDPEVVLASWCGKKVQPSRIRERAGWQTIGAVAHNRIFEVKSTYILQPGPASLTDGVGRINDILCAIHGCGPPSLHFQRTRPAGRSAGAEFA